GSSGARRMIVAVNKMDHPEVNFSQARYDEICAQVTKHLCNLGYDLDRIETLPISALTGYNLFERGSADSTMKGNALAA
ncbi:elongation factor 1-alpha, putative, partial [Perkinsus marinus ATCC 50983]